MTKTNCHCLQEITGNTGPVAANVQPAAPIFLCTHELSSYLNDRHWTLAQVDDYNHFRSRINAQQPKPWNN